MDTLELIARHGDAARQAIELGEIVHIDTASVELTDDILLFAINSGYSRPECPLTVPWFACYEDQ